MNGTATERSVNFLIQLSAERTPHVTEQAIREWVKTVHWSVVSKKIDELKELPIVVPNKEDSKQSLPDVPAGHYAIDGEDGLLKFYEVDRPTEGRWAGYTFVAVQASDERHPVRGYAARRTILEKIVAVGIQAAMERYGREIGRCGHCRRTLTNEESRKRGIGPVCASKMGW